MPAPVRRLAVFALLALFAAAAHADPKAEVIQAFEAMLAKGTYQSTVENNAGTKNASTVQLAVQLPDRFHIRTETQGAKTEMVLIPGGTYMNNSGNWIKLPMDMSAVVRAYSPEMIRQGIAGMTNVVSLGAEVVDNVATRVYTYDTTITVMKVTASSKVRLYVAADSGLIARMDSEGTAMGMSSQSVARYRYDAVEVKAPI